MQKKLLYKKATQNLKELTLTSYKDSETLGL